ncbi:MAG TPA: aromatic amino acid lyase, partial [Ktedonobacterales bacterium]|nr:aromatic amino acid lyase [Ktedonobacterales bacterium]
MPKRSDNGAEDDHPKRRGNHTPQPVRLDGGPLTLAQVAAVAHDGAEVTLTPTAIERVATARALVDRLVAEDRTVYGITTGFGHLSRVKIAHDELAALQRNLVRSHASGVGEPFDIPTMRAVMLLLAASLARGHSGVRLVVLEQLIAMLRTGVTPVVPMRGSVGA